MLKDGQEFPRQKGLWSRVKKDIPGRGSSLRKGRKHGRTWHVWGAANSSVWACAGLWWERRLARRAGPEPGFVPPSTTQMLSGHLPTWVLTPTGT